MAASLCAKSSAGSVRSTRVAAQRPAAGRVQVVVRAAQNEAVSVERRAVTLGLLSGAAALLTGAPASQAAYGDAANVFGKVTNTSGFTPYAGEGFSLSLPAKWNPSKENDFPNLTLRYEDNGDAVNNLVVIAQKTDKKSIEEFGTPDAFLKSLDYLFGKQAFAGKTVSEGGFAPDRVSAASLLDVSESTDKKGKKYFNYDLLVRSADGDEGGRHQLIKAAVGNGTLYILKVQIGDKRWFKGAKKDAVGAVSSFTVA